MDKEEAILYLKELEKQGISLGLERITQFLELLGNPQNKFKSIHIAGTNGKGSTASMLYSILQKAGHKVGLYTSPHLVEFNERIQINGKNISDKDLARLVEKLGKLKEKHFMKLTYFEFTTALAFQYFAEQQIDFAVVEVGMGGRLDATNTLSPIATAITNIAFEHESYLGNSIEKISFEKAGIIKHGIPLLTTEKNPKALAVFKKVCREKNCALVEVKKPFDGKLSLKGEFQKENAALAIAIAKQLGIESKKIQSGLETVFWPGRFEVVSHNPTVLLDCAHNVSGIKALKLSLQKQFPSKKFFLVFGASSDKNIEEMLYEITPVCSRVIATQAMVRAAQTRKIVRIVEELGKEAKSVLDVKEAVKEAIKEASLNEIVLVCGSCFVVGEAEQLFSE